MHRVHVAVRAHAHALALLTLVVVAGPAHADDDDDGFGGAPPAPPADTAPSDDACTIKGDDGVWRSCADALALKKAKRAPPADVHEEAAPVDPEQEKLRAAFTEAE